MAVSNSAQTMTKGQKIKYIVQVLYGLSDSQMHIKHLIHF